MVIRICRFENGEDEKWNSFVRNSSEGGHCHLAGWSRVIEAAYGHPAYYLWAQEGDRVRGILPMIFMKSFLSGRSLVSMPFLDDGGICAEEGSIQSELYQAGLGLMNDLNASSIDLRHRNPTQVPLPLYQSKVTLKLKLQSDPDRMLRAFDAKLRNQIRKAQRSGVSALWVDSRELNSFYDVFAMNMRYLGSPVHSQSFFKSILKEFPDSTRLILVRKGEETIGGGLCVLFKDSVQMPWASSRREYFSICPNNLLYWEVIRWACEKGYGCFDFGRSSPGGGTYRFKKQWGSIEEPLNWQGIHKSGGTLSIRADDPKYQWAVRLWSRLPLSVTKSVGPFFRRQMSN